MREGKGGSTDVRSPLEQTDTLFPTCVRVHKSITMIREKKREM
jgi:hypothetical protein